MLLSDVSGKGAEELAELVPQLDQGLAAVEALTDRLSGLTATLDAQRIDALAQLQADVQDAQDALTAYHAATAAAIEAAAQAQLRY